METSKRIRCAMKKFFVVLIFLFLSFGQLNAKQGKKSKKKLQKVKFETIWNCAATCQTIDKLTDPNTGLTCYFYKGTFGQTVACCFNEKTKQTVCSK